MSFLVTPKIMLRSLFSKPATAMYPLKKKPTYAATRGSINNNIDVCVFCGICVKKCPTGALAVSKDNKTWEIDRFKCIACNACVSACPKKCLGMDGAYTPPALSKTTERLTQPVPSPRTDA